MTDLSSSISSSRRPPSIRSFPLSADESAARKTRALDLFAGGMPRGEIARQLDCTRHAIIGIIDRHFVGADGLTNAARRKGVRAPRKIKATPKPPKAALKPAAPPKETRGGQTSCPSSPERVIELPVAVTAPEPALRITVAAPTMSEPEPIPAPEAAEDIAEIELQLFRFFDTGSPAANAVFSSTKCSCRFPIGDPRHDDFRFCGAPKASSDTPYCPACAAIAFSATGSRKVTPSSRTGALHGEAR
jgi:GcrA cell cycle regulator